MTTEPNNQTNTKTYSLIGEILLKANLISSAQLELALENQRQFFTMRLGEIMALRGWLKQQTIDFLVENITNPHPHNDVFSRKLIGQYFQEAGLLTQEQVEIIIQEQKKLGLKFGYIAVLKGFLSEQTVNFFLEQIINKIETKEFPLNQTSQVNEDDEDKTLFLSEQEQQALLYDSDYVLHPSAEQVEKIKQLQKNTTVPEGNTIITPLETLEIKDEETSTVYCDDIAYSPIWIDYEP